MKGRFITYYNFSTKLIDDPKTLRTWAIGYIIIFIIFYKAFSIHKRSLSHSQLLLCSERTCQLIRPLRENKHFEKNRVNCLKISRKGGIKAGGDGQCCHHENVTSRSTNGAVSGGDGRWSQLNQLSTWWVSSFWGAEMGDGTFCKSTGWRTNPMGVRLLNVNVLGEHLSPLKLVPLWAVSQCWLPFPARFFPSRCYLGCGTTMPPHAAPRPPQTGVCRTRSYPNDPHAQLNNKNINSLWCLVPQFSCRQWYNYDRDELIIQVIRHIHLRNSSFNIQLRNIISNVELLAYAINYTTDGIVLLDFLIYIRSVTSGFEPRCPSFFARYFSLNFFYSVGSGERLWRAFSTITRPSSKRSSLRKSASTTACSNVHNVSTLVYPRGEFIIFVNSFDNCHKALVTPCYNIRKTQLPTRQTTYKEDNCNNYSLGGSWYNSYILLLHRGFERQVKMDSERERRQRRGPSGAGEEDAMDRNDAGEGEGIADELLDSLFLNIIFCDSGTDEEISKEETKSPEPEGLPQEVEPSVPPALCKISQLSPPPCPPNKEQKKQQGTNKVPLVGQKAKIAKPIRGGGGNKEGLYKKNFGNKTNAVTAKEEDKEVIVTVCEKKEIADFNEPDSGQHADVFDPLSMGNDQLSSTFDMGEASMVLVEARADRSCPTLRGNGNSPEGISLENSKSNRAERSKSKDSKHLSADPLQRNSTSSPKRSSQCESMSSFSLEKLRDLSPPEGPEARQDRRHDKRTNPGAAMTPEGMEISPEGKGGDPSTRRGRQESDWANDSFSRYKNPAGNQSAGGKKKKRTRRSQRKRKDDFSMPSTFGDDFNVTASPIFKTRNRRQDRSVLDESSSSSLNMSFRSNKDVGFNFDNAKLQARPRSQTFSTPKVPSFVEVPEDLDDINDNNSGRKEKPTGSDGPSREQTSNLSQLPSIESSNIISVIDSSPAVRNEDLPNALSLTEEEDFCPVLDQISKLIKERNSNDKTFGGIDPTDPQVVELNMSFGPGPAPGDHFLEPGWDDTREVDLAQLLPRECNSKKKIITRTKGIIQYVIMRRKTRSDLWDLFSKRELETLLNYVEAGNAKSGNGLSKALKYGNMWGEVPLLGLYSNNLSRMNAYRFEIEKFDKDGFMYQTFPRLALNRRLALTMMMWQNLEDFPIESVVSNLQQRNSGLTGRARVVRYKPFSEKDRDNNDRSMKGARLVQLDADRNFLDALYNFPRSYRFGLGAAKVIIRGGERISEPKDDDGRNPNRSGQSYSAAAARGAGGAKGGLGNNNNDDDVPADISSEAIDAVARQDRSSLREAEQAIMNPRKRNRREYNAERPSDEIRPSPKKKA